MMHHLTRITSEIGRLHMKRLLHTLFTIVGPILAGTVLLAAAGSYVEQGTAPNAAQNSHLIAHMPDATGAQQSQWRMATHARPFPHPRRRLRAGDTPCSRQPWRPSCEGRRYNLSGWDRPLVEAPPRVRAALELPPRSRLLTGHWPQPGDPAGGSRRRLSQARRWRGGPSGAAAVGAQRRGRHDGLDQSGRDSSTRPRRRVRPGRWGSRAGPQCPPEPRHRGPRSPVPGAGLARCRNSRLAGQGIRPGA